MTVLFKNQCRPTDGILHEYVRRVVCKDLIAGCAAAFVVCCIAIAPFLVRYQTRNRGNGNRHGKDALTLGYFGDHIEVNENGVRCQYTYEVSRYVSNQILSPLLFDNSVSECRIQKSKTRKW